MTIMLPYNRVSSDRQAKEGGGIKGQNKRSIDFGRQKGYRYGRSFNDEGVSGGVIDRPGMQQLLQYLDDHRDDGNHYVIIIDDIKRLARDVQGHFLLKTAIYSRGATIESPNHKFEDTPEGKFVETVLAGAAELERNQNRRQVLQKMKARLDMGYWCFCPPKGLKNIKDPTLGRVLASEEPYATIYKEAIEKFANGTFITPNDVRLFIWDGYKKVSINREPSLSTVQKLLRDPLYAGYLEYKPWGVPFKKAQHNGFISLEIYKTVQERLKQRSKPWKRKDWNKDFPLKPYVLCVLCSKPLTASWNKGRSSYYPNYRCRLSKDDCVYGGKSINKYKIEGEFASLLTQVKPSSEVIDLTKDVLIEQWSIRLERYSIYRKNAKTELEQLSSDIEELAGLAAKAEHVGNELLVQVYEKKIKKLAEKQESLEEELSNKKYIDKDFGTATKKVFNTLKKPMDMWKSDDYNDKRTILGMYFEDNLRYDLKTGFGTAGLAYPIELINQIGQTKNGDVEMSGSEPESVKVY